MTRDAAVGPIRLSKLPGTSQLEESQTQLPRRRLERSRCRGGRYAL